MPISSVMVLTWDIERVVESECCVAMHTAAHAYLVQVVVDLCTCLMQRLQGCSRELKLASWLQADALTVHGEADDVVALHNGRPPKPAVGVKYSSGWLPCHCTPILQFDK